MLLDPQHRIHARRERIATSALPPEAAVALAAECQGLRDLVNWQPVGSLVDELIAAVHGEGALTRRDITRLRVWARNWIAIRSSVRDFYTSHHDEPAATEGLWYILGSRKRKPPSWRIRRLFTDVHGFEPPVDLLPPPITQEPS